jgi:hypothetical protein
MQGHSTSEFSLGVTAIAVGFGGLIKLLITAEPLLASLSYLIAIIAGLLTIYYKLKRKG